MIVGDLSLSYVKLKALLTEYRMLSISDKLTFSEPKLSSVCCSAIKVNPQVKQVFSDNHWKLFHQFLNLISQLIQFSSLC